MCAVQEYHEGAEGSSHQPQGAGFWGCHHGSHKKPPQAICVWEGRPGFCGWLLERDAQEGVSLIGKRKTIWLKRCLSPVEELTTHIRSEQMLI